MAKVLHQPIFILRETIPMSEVRLWAAYFATRCNRHEKEDYYLAQIAKEIRQVFGSGKKRLKINDFLIKFKAPRKQAQNPEEIKKWAVSWLNAISGASKKRPPVKQTKKRGGQ